MDVTILEDGVVNPWIILVDHLAPTSGPDVGMYSDVGKSRGVRPKGFLALTPEQQSELLPVQFRLYDDDKELYYEGRMKTQDCSADNAFGPMDWATNWAGCTYMMVRELGRACEAATEWGYL